jgi:thiol-disulfide isomerase/thioredoxin
MALEQHVNRAARVLLSDYLLLTLLVTSLGGNVYQALRLSQCGRISGRPDVVTAGTAVPSFEALDVQGNIQTVRLSGQRRPTVVFAYSPNCVWCKATWPLFSHVAKARAAQFRFMTLCLGVSPVFRDDDVAAFARPSESVVNVLHLTTVPQTILIEGNGRVQRVWAGAYVGGTRTAIERYFGLSLPNLSATERR